MSLRLTRAIEGVSKEAVKAAAKTNQKPLQKIMGALGEIFAPLIPALICGGLILGFRNVIGEIRFFENGTLTLADVSQFWAACTVSSGSSERRSSICCRWVSAGPLPKRWELPRFWELFWA